MFKNIWNLRCECKGAMILRVLLTAVVSAAILTWWRLERAVQVEVVHYPEQIIEAAVEQTKESLTVVMVACEGHSDKLLNSFERQRSQLMTSIKSVVYLTQRHIRFIIITDSPHVFDEILYQTRSWPATHRAKASFELVPLKYPEGFQDFKNLFRPCSTLRLFLPTLLPDEKAVIYMDSDVILLRPLEEFWGFFAEMGDKQAAAGVSFVPGYNKRPQHLRYGEHGFNAGLMLFNLTCMRQFPGGWENSIRFMWKNYRRHISVGDQDILNFLFSKNPSYFFLIECEWNFRKHYCQKQFLKICPQLSSLGAKAVHGVAGSFFSGGELQGFYRFWQDLNMSLPQNELYQKLKANLASPVEKVRSCGDKNNFLNMLTKQLSLEHDAEAH